MSEAVNILPFGYQDDTDESLLSKGIDGVFGLNQGAQVVKFEFNPNAGADNSLANAIDIEIKIGESSQRRRVFEITRVYDKDNNEVTDQNSDVYKAAYNARWKQDAATVFHVLKCFVDENTIKTALAQPLNSFADWARVVTSLMPQGFEQRPVDVFLEYQWSISEGQDQTYLQLPKNMKGGRWICPAQPGAFQSVEDEGGLKYVNEQGAEHPFTRNKNFMSSNKAKRQTVNDTLQSASSNMNSSPATASSW